MPMEHGDSSSSVAPPLEPSGIKEFEYYATPDFKLEPNRQPLTSEALDEQFGTHIHYMRVPVLHTEAVPETTVKDALKSYRKVWLQGPPSDNAPDEPRYAGMKLGVGDSIQYITPEVEDIHTYLRNSRRFGETYGQNAQFLMKGRPFDKPKSRRFLGYRTPTWQQVKGSNAMFDVRAAELSDLRTHLNREKHLKAYDPLTHELLGFVLDKDGKVLHSELHYIRP
ncbi:hypothetical protein NDA11_004062 [Ustilago hordei]|uniref:Uncharacterized protein n=1 Tax=Ustilago hordei TaxID=120017 RepID=I2G1E6_USTHO|nr:uncharacterized protein UHO2_03423 [Ustilago hordei]KAJ1040901.1 hypothetical protein NDA10_005393 [Ustilago hordei]KAJ1581229.1 hypothetical protein NDA15_007070 [Ustilago hordei]KAJ1588684.1 hypothetical protein NDA11_004062 [Ustilago hordei]UTT92275.1 hypothetical protein NDA17_001437 [Ustilago hordei]CCF52989.1 uncharacterized protein UHOR_04380 [Ustilago hordei]